MFQPELAGRAVAYLVRSNVFRPRDEHADRGSHGMFDAQAHDHDPWSWASRHRRRLGAAASLGAGSRERVAFARRRR